jgi:hypothetical protein
VRIRSSDGAVFPYGDPIPAGEERLPGVQIIWTSPDPQLVCLVQHRLLPNEPYVNASGWLSRGVYQFAHTNDSRSVAQEYRIKVLNQAGNANTTYATATLPAAP